MVSVAWGCREKVVQRSVGSRECSSERASGVVRQCRSRWSRSIKGVALKECRLKSIEKVGSKGASLESFVRYRAVEKASNTDCRGSVQIQIVDCRVVLPTTVDLLW